jgi:hypothetical protein
MQVVLTVNGPGEVFGWVYPLAEALRRRAPDLRLVACLLPCAFSSGAEVDVLRKLPWIDLALDVRQSMALITRGRRPDGWQEGPSLVMHLGGDLALSYLLGSRLSAKRYAYAEHATPILRRFDAVFFSGLSGGGASFGATVGELMVDAVRLRRREASRAPSDRPRIAIFPSSRAYMAIHALPYFAARVDALAPKYPHIDWVTARSPFIPLSTFRTIPPPLEGRRWPASELRFREGAGGAWFETEGGNRIAILDGPDAIATADLALTIPGTNTGELAAAGVPMVVALPTYLGEDIPLPGLPGHLGRIPIIGRNVKRFFGWRRVANLGLLALPNVRAGEMLVPEFLGEGLQDDIDAALSAQIEALGQDGTLRDRLREAMGRPGAAEELATRILAEVGLEAATEVRPAPAGDASGPLAERTGTM